jgi:hypothetical protein
MNYHKLSSLFFENKPYTEEQLIFIKNNLKNLFYNACIKNNKNFTEWLYYQKTDELSTKFINDVFKICCGRGHLETIIILNKISDEIDIHNENNSAFKLSCNQGRLEVAKYLYELSKGDININEDQNTIFKQSCINGHLEVAKWLYDLSNIYKHRNIFIINTVTEIINLQKIFAYVCENNHLDIAKWLHKTSRDHSNYIKIHVTDLDNFSFNLACSKNHLEIMQWLYDTAKKSNKIIKLDEFFEDSCKNNKLPAAQWLYETSKNDNNKITKDFHLLFGELCVKGYLDVAKLVHDVNDKTDIRHNNDYTFRHVCQKGLIHIADWLCELVPDYYYYKEGDKLIYKIKDLKNDIKNNLNLEEMFYFYKGELIDKPIEKCPICFSDDEYYQIKFRCNHTVCMTCYSSGFDNDKCYYRCHGSINPIKIVKFKGN